MQFIHSNLLKDHTWATEKKILDLPVNPISHLVITLDGYNVTDETTMAEILGFLNKVTVVHRGNSIIDLESEDLAFLQEALGFGAPVLTSNIATDNYARELTLIVPFGRMLFNPDECFHATKKGELQLHLDCTVPTTSFDNGIINIEACELLGATPSHYLKSTLLAVAAPGATGNNDISLPIGNDIAKILLYTTTIPAASSHTWGIQDIKVLVDNSEYGYVSTKGKCQKGLLSWVGMGKTHDIAAYGSIKSGHYFMLDYDPLGNGMFLLNTEGKSSVKVRMNMGVDEAAKVIPVELVKI